MRAPTRRLPYGHSRVLRQEPRILHGSSMRARVRNRWGKIQTSFWFIPGLMSGGSLALAAFLLRIDAHVVPRSTLLTSLSYRGSAEGAVGLLSLIASSMMGIAGVTFSVTIVALTVASGQFSSRLLRNFMRDLGNQLVLGTYTATFVYCLWVVNAIHSRTETDVIPRLSVSAATVLALLGLGVLIFFFHHVSTSIQAGQVIVDAFADLIGSIERLLLDPEAATDSGSEEEDQRRVFVEELDKCLSKSKATPVASQKTGYIQAIDHSYLLSITKRHDIAVQIQARSGDFIIADSEIVTILSKEPLEEDLTREINSAFFVGRNKTAEQDIEFSLDQLVDVAVRALSPRVNDPGTAIVCLDYLAAAIGRAASKQFPSGLYRDDEGSARVFACSFSFRGLCDAAFLQIRQNSRSSVSVHLRMLEVLDRLAPLVSRSERIESLRHHADLVYKSCRVNFTDQSDIEDASLRYAEVQRGLAR